MVKPATDSWKCAALRSVTTERSAAITERNAALLLTVEITEALKKELILSRV